MNSTYYEILDLKLVGKDVINTDELEFEYYIFDSQNWIRDTEEIISERLFNQELMDQIYPISEQQLQKIIEKYYRLK